MMQGRDRHLFVYLGLSIQHLSTLLARRSGLGSFDLDGNELGAHGSAGVSDMYSGGPKGKVVYALVTRDDLMNFGGGCVHSLSYVNRLS